MPERFEYRPENAEAYRELGIKGTSFEPLFEEIKRMLGDLRGKQFLDFGSGAGRSAKFLKGLGADKIVGVDRERAMIEQASKDMVEGIQYHLITEKIPLPDESVDGALSSEVFMEMKSVDEMRKAMSEIRRVLKPGGELVSIVTNPKAYGHDFKSFSFPDDPTNLKSGDEVRCIIKGKEPFTIIDHFYTEDDYRRALESAGFTIEEITYPMPKSGEWLDETKVAPGMVIRARREENSSTVA